MKKTTKGWLIAGAALFAGGCMLFAGALASVGFDFSGLGSAARYKTLTEEVKADFDNIELDTDTASVELLTGSEKTCKAVFRGQEKSRFTAEVKDKTLVIRCRDERKWYEYIGFFSESPKLTVTLPKTVYGSLSVKSASGDVSIPRELTIGSVAVNGDTSDVNCKAEVTDTLSVHITTGDIRLSDAAIGSLQAEATTGDIRLDSVDVRQDIGLSTSTGDISLSNTVAGNRLSIACTTGDVSFDACDAKDLSVVTTTGDVKGTLLTGKVFVTASSTGDISVPQSAGSGRCEITTTTGDISMAVGKN